RWFIPSSSSLAATRFAPAVPGRGRLRRAMQEASHPSCLCPAAGFCYTLVFRLEEATCFPVEGEIEHVPKPNTNRGKSAIRSLRVARTRTLRNQSVRSAIKTFVKKTRAAIVNGEEQAAEFLQQTA